MNKKYTAMVINGVFGNKNMLILKSEGSETIIRYDETISSVELHNILKREDIKVEDCKIVVVDSSDWRGNLRIETY